MRDFEQSDLDSAARGLNMLGMSPAELDDVATMHEDSNMRTMFASQVIVLAARQMAAAKRRAGSEG